MIKVNTGNFLNRIYSRALLLVGAILLGGCTSEEPVSGPSECRSFNVASHEREAENKKIEAIRQLRDHYIDCNLGRSNSEIVKWGKLAAEHGSPEDKELFIGISATFSPKEHPEKRSNSP